MYAILPVANLLLRKGTEACLPGKGTTDDRKKDAYISFGGIFWFSLFTGIIPYIHIFIWIIFNKYTQSMARIKIIQEEEVKGQLKESYNDLL